MEWKRYERLDKKKFKIRSRMQNFSKTFDIDFYVKDGFKETVFLGYKVKLKEHSEIDLKDKHKLERIIKYNNIALSNQLPEIVDYVDNTVFMEFFDGYILEDAIKENYFVRYDKITKRDVDEIALKRIMRSIVPTLVDFQSDLLNKGLVHIGIFPEHIIVQRDDILKFKGLMYLVRHENNYINILEFPDEIYKNLSLSYRYFPPELIDCLKYKNVNKVDAKTIFSYQLGLILFDIFTKGKYINFKFSEDMVKYAYYFLGTWEKKEIIKLILDLTNPSPNKRISSFDEIKERCREFIKW